MQCADAIILYMTIQCVITTIDTVCDDQEQVLEVTILRMPNRILVQGLLNRYLNLPRQLTDHMCSLQFLLANLLTLRPPQMLLCWMPVVLTSLGKEVAARTLILAYRVFHRNCWGSPARPAQHQ